MAERSETPEDTDEHDLYIAQLQEVFRSCSSGASTDFLNREELFQLCDKLQLKDQAQYLVDELLKDKQQVAFDEFKDTFVTILCQMMPRPTSSDEETEGSMLGTGRSVDSFSVIHSLIGDGVEEGEEEEEHRYRMNQSEESDADEDRDVEEEEEEEEDDALDAEDTDEGTQVKREVSPRYTVGKKRYGRRSLPVSTYDFACLADDEDDDEVASSTQSLKRSLIVDELTDTEEVCADSLFSVLRLSLTPYSIDLHVNFPWQTP